MRRGILLLALGWVATSCQRSRLPVPFEHTRFMMDTVVRIAVYDPSLTQAQAERAIARAFEAMAKVESQTSAHLLESEISRLNRHAGGPFVRVSEETRFLFTIAQKVSESTGGAFDVTIGAVKTLWPLDGKTQEVPDSAILRSRTSLVDYRAVEVKGDSVRLPRTGMQVDMGGIAKGLAIDRAVEVLQKEGVHQGLVDAGGDLRIFGKHPSHPHWRIGIKHPRPDKTGSIYAVLETGPAAIATSGDYERYFMSGGRRYHHLLDPKTGYPARDCVSVTIVTESATWADALATGVFILGPEEGMRLIESLEGVEGLILFEKEGRLLERISPGLKTKLRHIAQAHGRD